MGYFTQIETKNPTSIISLALILYQMRRSELLLTVNKIEDGSTPSLPRGQVCLLIPNFSLMLYGRYPNGEEAVSKTVGPVMGLRVRPPYLPLD